MSEIRENLITGSWTIFAPKRNERPNDHKNKKLKVKKEKLLSYEKICPFCPGNEDMLPSVLYEAKSEKSKLWITRVVPNKYPALDPINRNEVFASGIYSYMRCAGYQEVIVETPKHNKNIAELELVQVESLIETYHRRFLEHIKDRRIKTVLIFRNQGFKSGSSRIHAHSQLVAMGFVPNFVQQAEIRAKKHFMITKKNLFLEVLKFELKTKKRIVYKNKNFVAFIPYAAQVPYEIYIMPIKQKADFGKITDVEKKDFAKALSKILKMLYKKLENPDYNMVIHTAPKDHSDSKYMQWYLQIRPVFSISAGFELATQMFINSAMPEDCAKYLTGK